MLRLVLPGGEHQAQLYFVVDEVSGVYRHRRVRPVMQPEEDTAVWEQLEAELAEVIGQELARSPQPYTGLRGTTVLGCSQLPDGRLLLRSRTDVMTFDTELAMVARKALNRYLGQPDAVAAGA